MPRTSSIHRSRKKLPRTPPRAAQPPAPAADVTRAAAPTRTRLLKTKPAPEPPKTAAEPPQKPQSAPAEGFVAVGRVLAPFGLKGELKVQPLTDNPRRFAPRSRLFAGDQPVTVLKSREAQGHVFLMLKGYADRGSVDRFRHALLQVPEAELEPLPEGEYYRFQLIGLTVIGRDGVTLGSLDEIIETGVNDVYRVRTPDGKDILIPALDDVIVSVDLAAKRMVVDPPVWR